MNARLEAYAALGTVPDAEVKAAGVTLFHLVDHINLIRTARNTLSICVDGFEIAQTVQTLFTLIDQIATQPGTFHLAHFTTQDGIFRGIVTFKADLTHVETVTRIHVYTQFNRLVSIVDFRLRLYARVGITIAPQKLLDIIFHFGHFGAVIEFTRFYFRQGLNFGRVSGQVTTHLYPRKLVLLAFCDVDGDIDTFLIRSQADLRRVDIETSIAAIQIVTTQGFKVARQFLFLVFTIAHHVPPRHFVAKLEVRDQLVGCKCMVTNDIDLLDLRRDTFLEHQFEVNAVTRQRRHHRFHTGAVLTYAIVEIFQAFFDIGNRGAIERLANTHARRLEVLLQHVIFYRFVTGESDAGNRRTFFYLNQKGITIAQDADILKVTGGEQSTNGITDIFIINRVACAHRHTEESRTNGDSL